MQSNWTRYNIREVSYMTAAMSSAIVVLSIGMVVGGGVWTGGTITVLVLGSGIGGYLTFKNLWRCGIWVRPDGAVKIVNPFRTYRLKVDELREIRIDRQRMEAGTRPVEAVLTSGQTIRVRGVNAPMFRPRSGSLAAKPEELVKTVNTVLDSLQNQSVEVLRTDSRSGRSPA